MIPLFGIIHVDTNDKEYTAFFRNFKLEGFMDALRSTYIRHKNSSSISIVLKKTTQTWIDRESINEQPGI